MTNNRGWTTEARLEEIDGHTVKFLRGTAGGCALSDCEKYRYVLTRPPHGTGKCLGAIGHNPSKADHIVGDVTATKLMGFAERLGCGCLAVGNIFAYRTTDPDKLLTVDDPIGPVNHVFLQQVVNNSDIIIACWGEIDRALWGKAAQSMRALRDAVALAGKSILCLGKTKDGKPRHPSRLGYDDGIKALCAF